MKPKEAGLKSRIEKRLQFLQMAAGKHLKEVLSDPNYLDQEWKNASTRTRVSVELAKMASAESRAKTNADAVKAVQLPVVMVPVRIEDPRQWERKGAIEAEIVTKEIEGELLQKDVLGGSGADPGVPGQLGADLRKEGGGR